MPSGVLRIITIALEDENQVRVWELTPREVIALKKLKGKQKLFQLVDDLRAKKFLERAEKETNKSKAYFDKVKADMKAVEAEAAGRMDRIKGIKPISYRNLTEGTTHQGDRSGASNSRT